MGNPAAKGAGTKSWAEFIDRRFGAGTMNDLVATLPSTLRTIWPDVLPSAWYPARFTGLVWAALVERHGGRDRAATERMLVELGRYVAEDNLSNVYRFLLSVMSPDRLLAMMPRLWGTYFDDIKVVTREIEPGRLGEVRVFGLGDVAYLGPVACGWLAFAYERAGARGVEVWEEGYRAGRTSGDPLVFMIRWH